MAEPKRYKNGRVKGRLALTRDEHEWLLQATSSGLLSREEIAARLGISVQTYCEYLKRPLGYVSPKRGPKKKVNG